jgi:hypothetical protein
MLRKIRRKKYRLVVGGILVFLLGFFRGVLEKTLVRDGFFVVRLWSDVGQTWRVDARGEVAEITPRSLTLFLWC